MRRIPLYVLIELLKAFLSSLAVLTLVILLCGVVNESLRQGLGIAPILRIIPFVLPESLRFAVPATILFATCSVYGRMSAANEIVALKAQGISPLTVIWPVIVLSILLSLLSVWLNDLAATWGREGVHRVVLQSVEEIAYGMLRTQRSYGTNRFSINVKTVEGRKLIRPTLVFYASQRSPQITLAAAEAELHSNPERNELSILLTNGTIDVGNEVTAVFPDTIERVVPLSDASKKGEFTAGAGELPLGAFPAEIIKQEKAIRELEERQAAQAAFQLLTGDFPALAESEWTGQHNDLAWARRKLFHLQAEPWRRWANSFSCLFFVLFGTPLAIRWRTSDFWTTFGVAFAPVICLYYPLMAYFTGQAKSGELPFSVIWTGNLAFGLAGYFYLQRVLRY